ncbi:antiviral reverse transcriptase Drt3b [Gallaecimonas pentaromativorans]|uniref:antiviral reverse transcriptase Drt3b n=1 Tax=Gallaecimonas pentaromativorans TaxID=584787 RepID=UPI003A933098
MRKKINLDDRYRSLITEFTPFETPLNFSNDGFYKNIIDNKLPPIVEHILKYAHYTIPYQYKVDKDESSSRVLSLVSPTIQLRLATFYNEHYTRILSACSTSYCSIRYPYKLASIYFNSKAENIDTSIRKTTKKKQNEENTTSQNSFFVYKDYTHINRFTSSKDFIDLEGEYPLLLKLDIQSCFDSIYSHSICWAIKDKSFSKNNTGKSNFENTFDELMQKANYNETNGIITGPEVSRIFSEIIFQKIERNIIEKLSKHDIYHGTSFLIKRYVDDFFIFIKDESYLEQIEDSITDELYLYKLTINKSKRTLQTRPFYTSKDIAIDNIRELIKTLHESITKLEQKGDIELRVPFLSRKKRVDLVSTSIRKIKSIITEQSVSILDLTQYIQKSIKNLILDYIKKVVKYSLPFDRDSFEYLATLFDLSLYFYSLDRRTTSSFSFCHMNLALYDFISEKKSSDAIYFSDKLSHYIKNNLESININKKESNKIELYNMSLTLQYISKSFEQLLNSEDIQNLIDRKNFSYFDFISLTFICGDKGYLTPQLEEVLILTEERLNNLLTRDGIKSSEFIHMLLDFLSCPYVNFDKKTSILDNVLKSEDIKKELSRYQFKLPTTKAQKEDAFKEIVDYCELNQWFTNWKNTDIRRILVSKELNPTY